MRRSKQCLSLAAATNPGKRHFTSISNRVLELEQQSQSESETVHKSVYSSLLQSCTNAAFISTGKRLHTLLQTRNLLHDTFLANHLLAMYSRCSATIHPTSHLFATLPCTNVVSWNITISAHVHHRHPATALHLFHRMNCQGLKATTVTFIAIVGACSATGDASLARRIHSLIVSQVRDLTVVLSTALITMYGKCREVTEARKVFDGMTTGRNHVSWNAMIGAYAQQGLGEEALELFNRMEMEFQPSEVTFVSALDACGTVGDLAHGRRIHSMINFTSSSTFPGIVNTALVNMYAKCGSLGEARGVFDKMVREDVVAWTAMVVAYVQHGEPGEALIIFWRMELEGVRADKVLFVSLLDACSCLGDLTQARQMHRRVEGDGFGDDQNVASGLVNMYRKCGSISDARDVFMRMKSSSCDQLYWNAMIAGYAEVGGSQSAIETYRRMDLEGVKPDSVTFNSVLGACSSARFLPEGRAVHARCVSSGIDVNLVGVSLLKMYGQCGELEDAKAVFDSLSSRDVVAWSALIGAYSQHGGSTGEALEFSRLMQEDGVEANDITFISLLDACANAGDLSRGQEIHARVAAAGYDDASQYVVVATALVNMYGKCGDLPTARSVFDRIHPRDVVAWTAMISAYVLHGCNDEALELYLKLEPEGMKADKVVYLSVLEACANLTALQHGRSVHASIVATGLSSDLGLTNALVNLYAKCGSLKCARELFDGMRCRDLVSWNTMITSYGHHGEEETAVEIHRLMKLDGVPPNDITFVSVLFVCSHAGLLEEGCRCFASITTDFCMEQNLEHYCCVIDLLGRLGNLDEAEELIGGMPEPCSVVWMSLLASCRIHGDTDRALRVAGRVAELDPGSLAGKVLLSNIYAAAGRWDEAAQVRDFAFHL